MVRPVVRIGALTTARSAVVVGLVTVIEPSAEATEVTVPVPEAVIHLSPVAAVESAERTCPLVPTGKRVSSVEYV